MGLYGFVDEAVFLMRLWVGLADVKEVGGLLPVVRVIVRFAGRVGWRGKWCRGRSAF